MYEKPEEGWNEKALRGNKAAAEKRSPESSPRSSTDIENTGSCYTSIRSSETLVTDHDTNYRTSGLKENLTPTDTEANSQGWTNCAEVRNPKAYEEIRIALLRIEQDLPSDQRMDWGAFADKPYSWMHTPLNKEYLGLVSGLVFRYACGQAKTAFDIERNYIGETSPCDGRADLDSTLSLDVPGCFFLMSIIGTVRTPGRSASRGECATR